MFINTEYTNILSNYAINYSYLVRASLISPEKLITAGIFGFINASIFVKHKLCLIANLKLHAIIMGRCKIIVP